MVVVLYAVEVEGLEVDLRYALTQFVINAHSASAAAIQRIIFCNKGSRLAQSRRITQRYCTADSSTVAVG
jgi:hypothetical protein